MRITLADVRQSRLPRAIGLCAANLPEIAAAVNEAQQRLINAGGDSGFWGGWSKVVFYATVSNPYITLPRQFARIINMDVCQTPIRINNEFYEVLPGGVGLMPDATSCDWCGTVAGYERGVFPTMVDLPGTEYLRVYITDVRDVNLKLMITGLDQNGTAIYSTLGRDQINGFVLMFAQPFTTSAFTVSSIQSVQKDVTYGDVILKSVSAGGVETTLSRYGPTEQNPAYRRYVINKLPANCCLQGTGANVAITAIAKLEYVPAYVDTDQLIIGNIPALIEECMSIRLGEIDSEKAQGMSLLHHKNAIRQLQNELRHYLGEQHPAVSVNIFTNEPLSRQSIGALI
jgi:hypothetical protein